MKDSQEDMVEKAFAPIPADDIDLQDESESDYSDATLTYSEAEEEYADTDTQIANYLLKHTSVTGATLSSALTYLKSWLQWEGLEWCATTMKERELALKDWAEFF